MDIAYVLDNQGNPLMPTKRLGRVRHLLQEGKAKIVCYKPFAIQLKYESSHHVQDLYGGIDPGRTNIGLAVVNGKGEVFYAANVTTRNREIPKLMTDRAQHRQASRRGQRLARKRLAKRNNTLTEFPNGRKLPGYKDGNMAVKDIINKESRFNNRKRSARWITPTAKQCVRTHINLIKHINKFMPIKSWTMEYNKFAFMQLDDGQFKELTFKMVLSKAMLVLRIISSLCKVDVVPFVVSKWIKITIIATISSLKVKEAAIRHITVLVYAALVMDRFIKMKHG